MIKKSIFQISKNPILGTKMQLIIVLTSFVSSLSVAIAFAEEPPNSKAKVLFTVNQSNQ